MRLNPIVTQPMFDADLHFFGPEEQIHRHLKHKKIHYTMPDTQPPAAPRLIARHMPEAINDFLHFQYGIHAVRLQTWPIYDEEGEKVIGRQPTLIPCTVFHLLGHGSNEASALRMARRALEKLTLARA